MTESPTKLKRQAKTLHKMLQKHGVVLTDEGEVDYSAVANKHVVQHLQAQESLVKVTLMQADLEWEYPQKLEKLMVAAELQQWLDEEEAKLTQNVQETVLLMDEEALATGKTATAVSLEKEKQLSYEEYFGLDDFIVDMQPREKVRPGKIPFEEFVKKAASENIFENDLLEQQYKFWESTQDREARLKNIWIDLKRKNALGGVDKPQPEDTLALNQQIATLIRKVRWRTDQELTRRNIEPLFKDNYTDKYTKDEFLIDAGFEFYKLKKLLEKNPRVLMDDPIVSLDYYKIIGLIKRKLMLEETSDTFAAADQGRVHWRDPREVALNKAEREQEALEKYLRSEGISGDGSISQAMDLDNKMVDIEQGIRSSKKDSAKDTQKIMMAFDKLATQFERTGGAGSTQHAKNKQGKEVPETAGMLKKRTVKKKEKSLSAKLRLKEKKNK